MTHVRHCYRFSSKVLERLARAAEGMKAPCRCRVWRVLTSKDEIGAHPGLAVKYRISGNQLLEYHVMEKGKKMMVALGQRRTQHASEGDRDRYETLAKDRCGKERGSLESRAGYLREEMH